MQITQSEGRIGSFIIPFSLIIALVIKSPSVTNCLHNSFRSYRCVLSVLEKERYHLAGKRIHVRVRFGPGRLYYWNNTITGGSIKLYSVPRYISSVFEKAGNGGGRLMLDLKLGARSEACSDTYIRVHARRRLLFDVREVEFDLTRSDLIRKLRLKAYYPIGCVHLRAKSRHVLSFSSFFASFFFLSSYVLVRFPLK